jgi:hypothetical protein
LLDFLDCIVHQPDGGAVTRQMPIAVFSEADVRRLEAIRLLDACGTLHQEGILDDHEYEAKRLELVGAVADRSGQR